MQPKQTPDTLSASPVQENVGEAKKKSGWHSFLSSAAIAVLAPLVAILLTTFVFQSYEVQGRSMESTLSDKDRLIILKLPATAAKITDNKYIPKRYDIIVFNQRGLTDRNNQDKQLIKRVIGLPGDHVVVKDGQITIFNAQNPEGYNPDKDQDFSAHVIGPTKGNIDLIVPSGHVFVSGDNRTDSHDSRDFGTVSSESIIGKLVLRIMPVNNFESF